MDVVTMLAEIRTKAKLSQAGLAQLLGTSLVSIHQWEHGSGIPSPSLMVRIEKLHQSLHPLTKPNLRPNAETDIFSSRGVRKRTIPLPLFDEAAPDITLAASTFKPILSRLMYGRCFSEKAETAIQEMLEEHLEPATVAQTPPITGISAGKNTYTYDAHTYHTKVPPQGIAELLKHYLPKGGLVFDPFAGSGMTGVASSVEGYDCILNELSPAACFIANRFTTSIHPAEFDAGVKAVLDELRNLRESLYTTICRDCGRPTEMLFTVWSYNVLCPHCNHEFLLWEHCRKYGRTVREHKILSEFPCPNCQRWLKKSALTRTSIHPVQVGYKCCSSQQQEVPIDERDLELIRNWEIAPALAEGFYPQYPLPDGVNLRQPRKHGLDRIDKFYTPRNLTALSHLWKTIHRVEQPEVAAFLAFVFTSLYQRVTRLSEFRFWGGSGNTARFNVPFIFNEANVFVTFERKAQTIRDHLSATAKYYRGKTLVIHNSATSLDYLANDSIDLIFTDPPFGANINYSEMNFLWEAWLDSFTDSADEAIINKVYGKDVIEYQRLITQSLKECYRVLRRGHWMLLAFMNSSSQVWKALQTAIYEAGFQVQKVDVFDKQHGTFKQFVSENTAGFDLILHCQKPNLPIQPRGEPPLESLQEKVFSFLDNIDIKKYVHVYLHVERGQEIDFRKLYSEWAAQSIMQAQEPLDFAQFRSCAQQWVERRGLNGA